MKSTPAATLTRYFSLSLALISVFLFLYGCSGDNGVNGISSGTVSGAVTDTFGNKVAGAIITPSPVVRGVTNVTADANGNYSLRIPNGSFTLTFARFGYDSQAQPVSVVTGQTTTLNVTLSPTANAQAAVNAANVKFVNGVATLTASAAVFDPALQGQPVIFTWRDFNGNVVGTGATITVNKPTTAAFKARLATLVTVRQSVYPPGHDPVADENDFDVPNFQPLDRFQVLAITQKAFEDGALTPYTVTATINGIPFSATPTASVPTNTLPFVPNGGLRNVPLGQPVVLQGKLFLANGTTPQTTWNWTITPPVGSNVTALVDPTTQYPNFFPDATGIYAITETVSGRSMNIYAGAYVGILVPAANDDPLGILDVGCSQAGCHPATTAFSTPFNNGAQFFSTTPINSVFLDWQQSGHREIMVKGMNEGSHYDINSCGKCHSVGYAQYSSVVKAGGFKETINASKFTNASFLQHFGPLSDGKFFKGFPQVLRVSEIQCETCHGPNGGAHAIGTPDSISSRFSVASDVCGVCHGEPLRHGRFQEWRESGHGDFKTAMGEGVSGVTVATPTGTGPNINCAGCHSGQGFPLLLAQLQGGNPLRTLTPANVAALGFLRTDNVQPQTCATCHPVHNPGKQPGLVGNIVILRGDYQSGGAFDGTTPLLPAGFQANGVGKGALCITCHNSRNGGVGAFPNGTATPHQDGDLNFGALTAYSGPHEACQGDVLMGRNSYYFSSSVVGEDLNLPNFVKVPQLGERSRHSFLADACVTCHLEKSPTDPALGYPPGLAGAGTNHTFNIVTDKTRPAADQINALCSLCHGAFDGTGVQKSFDVAYNELLKAAANAVLKIKFGTVGVGTNIPNAPAGTRLVFIPGRTPQVSVSVDGGLTFGAATSVSTYLTAAPAAVGTANTGPIVGGFQRDLAKANWNISLIAPKYNATFGGLSYDDGTNILSNLAVPTSTVGVAGDQSKGVHNPSFTFNVINVTSTRLNAL